MLPAKPPVAIVDEAESQHESSDDIEEGGVSTGIDEIPPPLQHTESSPPSQHTESPSPSQHTESPSSSHKETQSQLSDSEQPPLPEEIPPPLPDEPPPATEDDGWEPVWDETAQTFYFYNKHTQATQWENPRVPEAAATSTTVEEAGPPGVSAATSIKKVAGGYDPAIHGDYDPNADYARVNESQVNPTLPGQTLEIDAATAYAATGAFNRFTGKWQSSDINPEKFSDENKSRRQMNAFFDVDAAANSHDGKSLKAERSGKRVSKAELKAFREKRREKKEEKKRAWLRD